MREALSPGTPGIRHLPARWGFRAKAGPNVPRTARFSSLAQGSDYLRTPGPPSRKPPACNARSSPLSRGTAHGTHEPRKAEVMDAFNEGLD